MPDSPVLKIVCAIRMERSTRKNKKQRKCYRNRNIQGGGLGQGYMNGAEMLSRGYPVVQAYNSCGALSRPGVMTSAEISSFKGGLPGLSGGGSRRMRKNKASRKSRGQHKRRTHRGRRMHGGRYGMSMTGDEFLALGPRGGMMATAERISCESGVPPHVSQTTPTQPSVAMRGGGALQLAPTPFLQEQTAGYTTSPSSFLTATGSPILLNIPAGGRMGVPACEQTGGRRGRKQSGGQEDIFQQLTSLLHAISYDNSMSDEQYGFYYKKEGNQRSIELIGKEAKEKQLSLLKENLEKLLKTFETDEDKKRAKGIYEERLKRSGNLSLPEDVKNLFTMYDDIEAIKPMCVAGNAPKPNDIAVSEVAAQEAMPAPAPTAAAGSFGGGRRKQRKSRKQRKQRKQRKH